METNIIVFDDFYTNVDQVRDHALQQNFYIYGNYPGVRTDPEPQNQHTYLKEFFESILNKEIVYWPTEYNTAYQYTTEEDTTWVHHDDTRWAGVLYLTPDAPIKSGTSFYRHAKTKVSIWTADSEVDYNKSDEATNLDNWEQINFVGNVYNRLVLYNGFSYHRSLLPGFGKTKEDGRLFQTFFFNTGD